MKVYVCKKKQLKRTQLMLCIIWESITNTVKMVLNPTSKLLSSIMNWVLQKATPTV